MHFRVASGDPGGRWPGRLPTRQRGPGPDCHAPGADRTGRVPGTSHHPFGQEIPGGDVSSG